MKGNRRVPFLAFCCVSMISGSATTPVAAERERSAFDYSLAELRDGQTTIRLLEEARRMRAELEAREEQAKRRDDDDMEDDIDDQLEMVEFAEEWLTTAIRSDPNRKDTFSVNSQVVRILRGVEEPARDGGLPPLPILLVDIALGETLGQPLPYVPPRLRDQPMGRKMASRESVYLHQRGRDSFFTLEELARMTPNQVAELDVSPTHPAWYDRETFVRLRPDPVSHLQNFLRRGNTSELYDDGVLERGEPYDPEMARRVLFLEDIYLSGTSPKGTAEDEFGVEWKVKWGDEAAVEPVVNRLYLMAGAKMTDLVHRGGFGPRDTILVLREESEDDPEEDELYPTSLEEFSSALEQLYDFDPEPYIHSHGVITEGNVDRLLGNLTGRGKRKYRAEELIGREWVAFRECSLEQKTDGFIQRHETSRMSDRIAENDRVARGSFLFDMWIGNRDVKDDNNKGFFIRDHRDGDWEIAEYREGHHDLGFSLGSIRSSGFLNKFSTGRRFAYRGLFGKLRFRQGVIHHPTAWKAATWADGKWMAGRILAISEGEIRRAAAASGWPDFVQETLVYKLIERRNRIAGFFGLTGELDQPRITAPTVTISLATPEQIRAAEGRYGLPDGSLGEELASAGVGPDHSETVVKEGHIASCRDSALIRVLTRHRYPSGLDTRYFRIFGKHPKCLDH